MPETLVIIPCLNEAKTIEPLTRQLLKADANLRIVIADGGSTDQTIAIAQRLAQENPAIIYLHNPKRIQSAAINLAVTTYGKTCEYFIRIDAHADYPDDYCQRLLEEAAAQNCASIVVTMETKGKSPFQRAVAAAQNSKLGNGGSPHRSGITQGAWVDHGHHALMRTDAFTAIGGYDETFSHNEDAELDNRLLKSGQKIWLTAKTRLTYYPRASIAPLFRQYRGYGKGRIRNINKHKTRPKPRQMAPALVFPAFILALLTPVTCFAALPFALWAILCLGCGVRLGLKQHDNAVMLSGIAAMVMHFAWSVGFWQGVFHIMATKER